MTNHPARSENNEALSKILHEAVRPLPLNAILKNCLDILISVSWLSMLPKAGIFTTNSSQDGLELVAERNFGDHIKRLCLKVPFGHCYCGRAAQTKKIQHVSCFDNRSENQENDNDLHGHYNIPILSGDRVVGVVVFYLPQGTQYKFENTQFLERVADTLAMVITLHQQADELKLQTKKLVSHIQELDFQKHAFDEHAIVSIADVTGNFLYVNDMFCEVSGYCRSELIGNNHSLLSSGEHHINFYKQMWKTISDGQVWKGEIINMNKSGDFYWLQTTIVPTLNEHGKPFQYFDISTETTRIVKVEKKLRESRNHLELEVVKRTHDLEQALKSEQKYNTLQKQFLKMASHEFKTPLSIIDLTAQRLLKRQDSMTDDQRHDRYMKIRSAAKRITGLIESTLSTAKTEEQKLVFCPKLCDIKSILLICIQTQLDRTNSYEIYTKFENFPQMLMADPKHLKNIFANLLSNAVKYSPTKKTINIKGWSENNYVHVTIEDHGIGISQNELPNVFNLFFRTSTSAVIPGTGIGLSLVQKLLEIHGGNISLESIEGEGSTFKVSLPFHHQDLR